MNVFEKYAVYYNLLYKDKDYAAEVSYIDSLIQKFRPESKGIMDLGCGTGKHAILLAAKGYNLLGVDQSQSMLEIANRASNELDFSARVNFLRGDIRDFQVDQKFDVITSLFHVVSYQVTNDDLSATFCNANEHLNDGGIFIFDCWYGPGVLTDLPRVRIKRLEDDNYQITRIAEPEMQPTENLVNVNYDVFVSDKASGRVESIVEQHRMRYLFKPEIESIAGNCGFRIEAVYDYLSFNEPNMNSWNACFVLRKGLQDK